MGDGGGSVGCSGMATARGVVRHTGRIARLMGGGARRLGLLALLVAGCMGPVDSDEDDVAASAPAPLTEAISEAVERSHSALADLRHRMPPPQDSAEPTPEEELSFTFSPHGTIRGIWGPDLAQDLPAHDVHSSLDRGNAFLTRWGSLYGLRAEHVPQLRHVSTHRWPDLGTVLRYRQVLPDGTRIIHHDLRVWIRPDGSIAGSWGAVLPPVPVAPAVLTAKEVVGQMQAALDHDRIDVDPEPVLFDPALLGRTEDPPEFAWIADVGVERIYVSAVTGDELHRYDVVPHGDVMEIYHTPEKYVADLVFERNEPDPDQIHDPSWPSATYDAFVGLERVHDYLGGHLGRDGWNDDHDDPLHRSALYVLSYEPVLSWFGPEPAGGWWIPGPNSSNTMFGFPNEEKYVAVMDNTTCTDVIAHEFLGHGVPDAEDVFDYAIYEGKALQEGYGDLFGQFVVIDALGSTTWKMGVGESCTWEGWPIRDLRDPEDPINCPTCRAGAANYSNFRRWDFNGPHSDGTIIGKLAWLIGREPSEGSVNFGGQTVTGIGSLEAGTLFYDVLTGFATATTDLNQFGHLLRFVAGVKWGSGNGSPFFQVQAAVAAVGLWRPDHVSAGAALSTLRPVVETFTVGSQERTYYISTAWDGDHYLHAQHMSCIFTNNCGFGTATNLWRKTSTGPGVAKTSGKLHVFYGGSPWMFLEHVSMDSNGSWGSATSYTDPYAMTDSEPAVAPVNFQGFEYLVVYYRLPGTARQPIYYMNISASDGSLISGPFNTGYFAEGGLGHAKIGNTSYIVYVDEWRFKYFQVGGTEQLAPLWWDVLVTGSATATNTFQWGRLHVAAQTKGDGNEIPPGWFAYKSFCPQGSSCTYRPGEWTKTVALPPPAGSPSYVSAYGHPLLKNTALIHNGSSNMLYRFKQGE
jgi:hypothetical protein